MSTTRARRSQALFWLAIAVTAYVILSAAVAIATADTCDGRLGGDKSWQFVPPHWECPGR